MFLLLCNLLHSVWQSLGPSMLLQTASFNSLQWLSNMGRIKASDLFCFRIPPNCQQGGGGGVSKEGFLESQESALTCLKKSQAQCYNPFWVISGWLHLRRKVWHFQSRKSDNLTWFSRQMINKLVMLLCWSSVKIDHLYVSWLPGSTNRFMPLTFWYRVHNYYFSNTVWALTALNYGREQYVIFL